jgi:glycosyltransferase involved in cell wall biosynthesis
MDRAALVHDYLLVMRGAERTFAVIADMWPEAPVLTLLYDERGTDGRFAGREVVTSSLQALPVGQGNFRLLMPLFPAAVRKLPLAGYDRVISSSSAFAHGVCVAPGALHICYCHSPFRYAWHEEALPMAVPGPVRPLVRLLLRRHRSFDRRSVGRVDQFIANSRLTRDRIRRFWGRDAVIVHPPVDVERFTTSEPEDYMLYVGELLKHKRVELAISAARDAGRRIKVVGEGPEAGSLRARYDGVVEFMGRVSDAQLNQLYARCAALVVPNIEEFGIVAVEAQAAGRPVIGVNAGGTQETVIDGETGLLVPPDDFDALRRAMRQDFSCFESDQIRTHAGRFSRQTFEARLREIVDGARPSRRTTNAGQLTSRRASARHSQDQRTKAMIRARVGRKLRQEI